MTTKLKLTFALWCLGALTAPAAMAQPAPVAPAASAAAPTGEFVAEAPNLQLAKPQVKPMNACNDLSGICAVPEPGSLPLVALAAVAAFAVLRRKK